MEDSFERIFLSDEELSLLRRLNDGAFVRESDCCPLQHLIALKFVSVERVTVVDADGNEEKTRGVSIERRGKDYLAWMDAKKQDERQGFRRELFIALVAAVVASALTLIAEHFPEIVSFFAGLIQSG